MYFFLQIMTERSGDSESFTRAHIGECMSKVVAVDLHQTVTVSQVPDNVLGEH